MKIGFISLGCAKNLVDSEYLIGLFTDSFFEIENNPKKCDAILINTCAFIESAKEESINTILEMAELKKDKLKFLIVTGCFAQRYYDECLKELPEVDLFVRIDQYPIIDQLLAKLFNHAINSKYGKNRKLISNNYSAYLKISDGCDNCCSYCAIPLIRGKYRSLMFEDIILKAKELKQIGVKELNVVAQDTTAYGKDNNSSLALLLHELDKLDFKWIRVLYMYPDEISDELLKVMKTSKHILPYFDIPIQYGNDRLLKLMNRRGSVSLIKERVYKLRKMFPDAYIRTTLIVGFPHEDENSFNDTLKLVEELEFDSLGAFTYSKEEDTKAYKMKQVSKKDKMQRFNRLMLLQQGIIQKKNKEKIGNIYEVLIERYEGLFNRYVGRSYMSAPDGVDGVVYIKTDDTLDIGSFVKVKIVGYKDYDLLAEVNYN